jgi:hypothetical protein
LSEATSVLKPNNDEDKKSSSKQSLNKREDKKEKKEKEKTKKKQKKRKHKKGNKSNDDSTSNDNGKLQLKKRWCKRDGLRELPHVLYADEGANKKKKKEEKKKQKKGKKGEEQKEYIMSPYELQRQANMKRNASVLKALGL